MKSTNEIERQIEKKVKEKLKKIASSMVIELQKELNTDGYLDWYKGKDTNNVHQFDFGYIKDWEYFLYLSLEKTFLEKEIKKEVQSLLEKINLI